MTDLDLANSRKDYTLKTLEIESVQDNPLAQFKIWFEEALAAKALEANAMHLSTVEADGKPSARIVLLKELDEQGFVFFTNYKSRKGKALEENPFVALTFFWPELERQVRVEGKVQKVSIEESATYFHSRPRGSQLGAWASPQSQEIENRAVLEENLEKIEQQFTGQEIDLPTFWGGYVVIPTYIEFWQGRSNRLHDRIVFVKEGNNWVKKRLAP